MENTKYLRFWEGRIPGFIAEPVKDVGAAIRQTMSRVYNIIDKLKYVTEDLDIRDMARDPHAVEQLIDPKSDMAGIVTQLSHLALTTRYQVIKMEQYIRESKGWLTVNDWKFTSRKKKYIHN